ncbi:hypothetical protein OQH45_03505 [Acinetobacter baumannii]|uniref:hypothetical protein n=1 Tax=Acinetobacter baumannii TaxID=470 RepID=UPI002243DBAA|nr:hypothetical protein [Acinetobacter baumannii]MCW8690026.1 hypothetical protein [Acinetobacter baumannii]MCW8769758.1 hypothetical protein [Acinetobacter baumannii]
MNNLITAAEAFAALQKGKTVLCRPIGDMLDFSDLDQFPASVFGKPGFEFCIKIETIELAGITFTKPLTIDEYEEGQEVYVISTYSPTVYVLDFKTNALIDSINSGFVQRDAEVAKVIPSEVFPADKQPAIVITEQTNVTASEDLLTPVTNELNIKPNVNAQFEILLDAIRICQSEKELDSTCANLEKEGFTQEQIDQINLAKQERLIELDFIEMDAADTASEQVFSDLDAQANDEVATISMPENYESLVQSIQNFHTPEEVNSVIRYTTKWTEEQRKPLLNEMHKRLAELKQAKQEDDGLSPLIVRLQYAADLKTLEELELEIPSRHQDVHKTLWNMAKKRRSQLNAAAHEPAYLLEDGL